MRRAIWVRSAGVGICRLAVPAAVAVLLAAPASRASELAQTPYMGWNTYYGLGANYNEKTIKSVAHRLLASGLAAAGYRIVWLDFGWSYGERNRRGRLIVDRTRWPGGMAALTAWLHRRGLEAGIYTDAGRSGCSHLGVGSYGHYRQDANTFAAWGFDAVKLDFCGADEEGLAPEPLDTRFSEAIRDNSSHRPMILDVDNFEVPGQLHGFDPSVPNSVYDNYLWAPQIAQGWRTDTDIGGHLSIAFSNVVRNLDHDAAQPAVAGPGHWNDPDYLGPGLGMTSTEAQSQLSMWAMLAAPLIIGSDPRRLSSQTIAMLENANVIAIDQDSLGAQGTLLEQSGSGQVWVKPLADGDRAIALFNPGRAATQITTTATAAGLPPAGSYTLQDVWSGATTTTSGEITALVPAGATTLYRVSAATAPVSEPVGIATLTVIDAGSGTGTVTDTTASIACPTTCSAQDPVGTQITLAAAPAAGSLFAGWTGGGCAGTAGCTITLGGDTDVTATFVSQEPVTVFPVGDGFGTVTDSTGMMSCPGLCAADYELGRSVTLRATASAGSAFTGWSGGGCSGTGTCTIAPSAAIDVDARFEQLHTLTVSVAGAGAGTVTGPGISCPGACTARYPDGTPLSLTATPAAGSRFGAWIAGSCPSAGASCRLTSSSDISLTVAFDRPRRGTAYVVNGRSDTVTPLNLGTDRAEHAIRGFDRPVSVAIAPDGSTAYVVNSGNATVTPINLATNRRERAISGFDRPGPIAIAPRGNTAYVLEADRKLVPVELSTHRAGRAITFAAASGVGVYPASIAISRNGRTAYLGTFDRVRGRATGTVAAVDLSSGRVEAVIHGFAHPGAIAIAPDGRIAYVVDSVRGSVTPVNLATHRAIDAPALTAFGAFPGADAIALTPDGRTGYIAADDGLAILRTAGNRAQLTGLSGLSGARALAVTPDGRTVYVATPRDGEVVPVDVTTTSRRPAVPGFGDPVAIAITGRA